MCISIYIYIYIICLYLYLYLWIRLRIYAGGCTLAQHSHPSPEPVFSGFARSTRDAFGKRRRWLRERIWIWLMSEQRPVLSKQSQRYPTSKPSIQTKTARLLSVVVKTLIKASLMSFHKAQQTVQISLITIHSWTCLVGRSESVSAQLSEWEVGEWSADHALPRCPIKWV